MRYYPGVAYSGQDSVDGVDDESPTAIGPPPLLEKRRASGVILRVEEGQERGRSFELTPNRSAPLLIGQSSLCDVRLRDEHVSRRHASLEIVDDRIVLLDLQSANGTFVEGVSVVGAYLRGDESVRVGATTLRLVGCDGAQQLAVPQRGQPIFGKLVGATDLVELLPRFRELAASDSAVLIEGETGTGKELLAEALHAHGPRSAGPFIVFDVNALGSGQLETELFGEAVGSAHRINGGLERASGGTVLMDEVGDLDLALQAKLLSVIDHRELRGLGSAAVPVDVRLIATARRSLARAVQKGTFRGDLYERLCPNRVLLQPLSRRTGDIAELAHYFWNKRGGAPPGPPPDLVVGWEGASWPGNVRELCNAVARRIALGKMDGDFHPRANAPTVRTISRRKVITRIV